MFLTRRRLLGDRAKLGRWGEKRAERFLRGKGFRVLARGFSCRAGELDLVMVDGDGTVVFVEVRTRADESFGPAEATITPTKRQRLVRAARFFLTAERIDDRPLRFDVVTLILGRSSKAQIRHYENAFVP